MDITNYCISKVKSMYCTSVINSSSIGPRFIQYWAISRHNAYYKGGIFICGFFGQRWWFRMTFRRYCKVDCDNNTVPYIGNKINDTYNPMDFFNYIISYIMARKCIGHAVIFIGHVAQCRYLTSLLHIAFLWSYNILFLIHKIGLSLFIKINHTIGPMPVR